jgi:alkylation response protein AidB-like acyl-CoA dehydrogenase
MDGSPVDRARVAAERIAPFAPAIDRDGALPPEVAQALVDAGVYRLLVPRTQGGAEASPADYVATLETIASADGSAGWCAMIGATSSLMSVFLEPALAAVVYGSPDATSCGVFAPMGRATPVDGGLRVRGRWPFASGCEHARWRMVGVLVEGGPSGGGLTDVRSVLLRADETRIVDTWHVSGLRGTGSHDLQVDDVVVPTERMFSLFGAPRIDGTLYRMPFFGLLAAGVAAVAIGIGRAALEAFASLAATKRAPGAKHALAGREVAQLHFGQASARIAAGRAGLLSALAALEAELARGSVSLEGRARLRLAAAHATTEAAAAVDLVYHAAGATAVYDTSSLQRCFRDVHVATQHAMVSASATALAGRVLLGVEADTSTL